MSEKILELNEASFEDAISSGEAPVVVDFWAPWCGPCKAIAPILEEIAEEQGDKVKICKVNVDEESGIAGKYSIRAIPTLLIFNGGEMVEQVVGLSSKDDLVAKLNQLSV
jgi:thioredoxin 1|tara:strand:- start:898 stop:1227 length:330 start_codon:yes stop_codon:yes gene_type:complete